MCEAAFVFFRDRIYKIKTNEKTEGWNEKPSIEDVSFLSWKKVIPFQHSALSNDSGFITIPPTKAGWFFTPKYYLNEKQYKNVLWKPKAWNLKITPFRKKNHLPNLQPLVFLDMQKKTVGFCCTTPVMNSYLSRCLEGGFLWLGAASVGPLKNSMKLCLIQDGRLKGI